MENTPSLKASIREELSDRGTLSSPVPPGQQFSSSAAADLRSLAAVPMSPRDCAIADTASLNEALALNVTRSTAPTTRPASSR
jgi:hypothetical protein